MNKTDFKGWLQAQGQKDSSISSRMANCQTVCEYEGDLDTHYLDDRCHKLIQRLEYTKDDQAENRPPKHSIPICGNIYEGTNTYKAAVNLYVRFRDAQTGRTDPVQHVRAFVRNVFGGRTNQGGFDYYTYHIFRVEREAEEFGLPAGYDTPVHMQMLRSVALLHDTFEDTDASEQDVLEALLQDGLSTENAGQVLESVRKMTHAREVPYMDYVQALTPDLYALLTKRADLFTNMNVAELPNLPGLTDWEIQRLFKYRKAFAIVLEAMGKYSWNH